METEELVRHARRVAWFRSPSEEEPGVVFQLDLPGYVAPGGKSADDVPDPELYVLLPSNPGFDIAFRLLTLAVMHRWHLAVATGERHPDGKLPVKHVSLGIRAWPVPPEV